MKIFVTPTSFMKPQNEKARIILEDFADEVIYNPYGRPLVSKEIVDLAKGCAGYIAGLDYIDKYVLDSLPELKVISRYGAGVDRVDLDAAKVNKIVVTNTPGTNATAVCELAAGLMMSLARSIPKLDAKIRKGEWPRNNGTELKGKKLSILGLGAIGKKLALRAKAFEMTVSAYDPYIDKCFAIENDIIICSFDEAISNADFISLHMPLNEQTRHCIDTRAIDKMKTGTMIINTARGGLINEDDVYKAMIEGKIGGLALDAYEAEPVKKTPLMELDNVIFTPHTGAHTNEAIKAMGMMAVENMIAVLNNKECVNKVV